MGIGLIGKKLGTTQIFGENGVSIPVTVVKTGPCLVVQKKTPEKDGYTAVQLGFEEVTKASHKLAETLYKQTTGGAQGPGPGQEAPGQQGEARAQGGRGNDDVVDVEFEDVKK